MVNGISSFSQVRSTTAPVQAQAPVVAEAASSPSESVGISSAYAVSASELASVEAQLKGTEFKSGEVILRFKGGFNRLGTDSVASKFGGQIVETFDLGVPYKGDEGQIVRVALPQGVSVAEAVAAMKKDSSVDYVEPNFEYTLDRGEVPTEVESQPNDLDTKLWGLNNTGQPVAGGSGGKPGKVDADIDAPEAWAKHVGRTQAEGGPIVAVIDTGVDYNHPDLKANMWTNQGEIAGDGIDNDGNGIIDDVHGFNAFANSGNPMDGHSHGTHCAGTIGAVGNNGVGVTGVNQKANIMAIKIFSDEGRTSTDAILRGIGYATKMGARVTSNSWGGGPESKAQRDLFAASPALHIMAAGNHSANNDKTPNFPSNYDINNNVAVAAGDHKDTMASFTCYGEKQVDVFAPGVDIWSTVPVSKGSYGNMSGTSMATPHTAGVVTLLASAYPELSNDELKQALYEGVDKVDAFQGKVATGGRINADQSLDIAKKLAEDKKQA